jgi:hypothetical protein
MAFAQRDWGNPRKINQDSWSPEQDLNWHVKQVYQPFVQGIWWNPAMIYDN